LRHPHLFTSSKAKLTARNSARFHLQLIMALRQHEGDALRQHEGDAHSCLINSDLH